MFWNKNKNDKNNNKNKSKTSDKHGSQNVREASCVGKRKGQRSASDDIRAQALANARQARENLGDETLQKMAAAIQKMENSATARAKRQIEAADTDRVLDELKWMLDQKNS